MNSAHFIGPFLWYLIILFSFAMYVVLDGYDLGIGMLLLTEREDEKRDEMMEISSTVWDGNESWIVLIAVALFGGFPTAYSIILPALYIPLIVMLFSLIFRGISFEFQAQLPGYSRLWGRSFGVGSVVAAFSQGVILGALVSGIPVKNGLFSGGPFDFLSPFSILSGLTLMAFYGLLGAGWLPLYMALIGMGAEAASHRQLEALRDLSGYFLDRLQGLATLKRLGYAGRELENVESASGELGRRTMSVLRIAFLSSAVLEFFSTFAIAIVATYIGLVLLDYLHLGVGPGGMSLRVGFFVLLLAPAYFKPLRTFAAAYHDRANALAAARNLAPLAAPAEAPRYPERSTGQELPPLSSVESVELSGVTVGFDGRERPALSKVNLALAAGEKVAVTGPSGAGKSTLLEVVAGQVSPGEGEVLVDGRNLELVPVARWRQSTCWIGQRPYLFPGTIAQNISLGQPERSREEVEAAARRARPGLRGGPPRRSGRRDRGARGRALRRRSAEGRARPGLPQGRPLLLLDEPTAHLDAGNEAALVETIAELSEGRTVLIATHSPALIDLCDRAVHLEGGVQKEVQRA